MAERVGEGALGAFAREQIEATRNDPRLGRERGAAFADFMDAMEEIERTRMLGVLGLMELTHTLKRHERELGVSRDDEGLSPSDRSVLQAAWERAESASIEIRNQHPLVNAQALVSMNSALDALVEELVPAMREIRVNVLVDDAIKHTDERHPGVADSMPPELREDLVKALRTQAAEKLPRLERLYGSGIERYEGLLRQAGLGSPPDRPIPADLDQALTELSALRDALVHRPGRVDAKVLRQAPSLRYQDGNLVRMNDEDYRRYSAAVRCYSREIGFRAIRPWAKDGSAPDLANWRGYVHVAA